MQFKHVPIGTGEAMNVLHHLVGLAGQVLIQGIVEEQCLAPRLEFVPRRNSWLASL